MGQIIFLRHGQAKNNTDRILAGRTEGVPLTEVGEQQAQHTAELLEHMNISAIYSVLFKEQNIQLKLLENTIP